MKVSTSRQMMNEVRMWSLVPGWTLELLYFNKLTYEKKKLKSKFPEIYSYTKGQDVYW